MREYPQDVYGDWAGNPKGHPYDPEHCAERVYPKRGMVSYQCNRKKGHGDRGLFCKQHAKRHPA